MTFARFARLLAIVLVAFALWRTRPPAEPAYVAVLALPGAAADLVDAGAAAAPPGEIRVPPGTSGAAFWQRLLTSHEVHEPTSKTSAIWSGERASVRALGVPARLFTTDANVGPERAFLGSSSGVVVEAADITSGRLPFPYDRAVDAVAAAVAALPRDAWSEWIEVPPPAGSAPNVPAPGAEFQITRYTDSSYFFSPAYIVDDGTIPGEPFLRGLDRELRPVLAEHVIGLSRRRLAATRGLFGPGGETRPVVVFENVVEDAARVFAPDSIPGAVVEKSRTTIASTLSELRTAVGKDGIVLVVGGPPTTRQADVAAWYRIVRGDGRDTGPPPSMDVAAARTVVRYMAGISLDATEKPLVPSEIVSRFPIRPVVARAAATTGNEPPDQQWTASALEGVPGAVDQRN